MQDLKHLQQEMVAEPSLGSVKRHPGSDRCVGEYDKDTAFMRLLIIMITVGSC
jgi:hypothetical protein